MKKLLFILFILPVFCFAQSPVTPSFKRKIPIDSLLGYSFPGVTGTFWLPDTAWVKKHASGSFLNNSTSKQTSANGYVDGFLRGQKLIADSDIYLRTTTKKPWFSDYAVLNMAGDAGIRTHVGAHEAMMFNNLYAVGTAFTDFKYSNNGPASYVYLGNTGSLSYGAAPSGTAGTSATVTDWLKIDVNGHTFLPGLRDTTATDTIVGYKNHQLYKIPFSAGGSFLPLTFTGDNTVTQGAHNLLFNAHSGTDSTAVSISPTEFLSDSYDFANQYETLIQSAANGSNFLSVDLSGPGSSFVGTHAVSGTSAFLLTQAASGTAGLTTDTAKILFTDGLHGIGPLADNNIDTAKMSITPKAYVTSEWVLGKISGSGSFINNGSPTTLSGGTDIDLNNQELSIVGTDGSGDHHGLLAGTNVGFLYSDASATEENVVGVLKLNNKRSSIFGLQNTDSTQFVGILTTTGIAGNKIYDQRDGIGMKADSLSVDTSKMSGWVYPTMNKVVGYVAAHGGGLGFTPENVANKATAFGTLNNTLYPTTQAVSDFVDAQSPTSSNGITKASNNYKLGGTLSAATIITAGVNALTFQGSAGTGPASWSINATSSALAGGNAILQLNAGKSGVGSNLFVQVSGASLSYAAGVGVTSGISFDSSGGEITDNFLNKGLSNFGNYEANFTGKSLITKRYGDSTAKAKADSVKGTISGGGTTTNPLTLGSGLLGTSFDGSSAVTAKVDTSVIQTIANFFPKADTRYYTKTASDARYEVPLTFTSGVSRSSNTVNADTSVLRTAANSYSLSGMQTKLNNYTLQTRNITTSTGLTGGGDLSADRTLKADTSVLQTVLNFFPKGDTRYAKTSALPVVGNPSGLLTYTAVNGSNTTYERTDGLHAIDSTVVRSVANSKTLAQEQTALNLKANIATPTFTTNITTPLVIGGTTTTSPLTFKTTTGVGTTGADMIFNVGNNGATEAMRILNSGFVGIGTNAPAVPLNVIGATEQLRLSTDATHYSSFLAATSGLTINSGPGGVAVLTLNAASGVVFSGPFASNGTPASANIDVAASVSPASSTAGQYQFAGSSTNFFRTGFYGVSNTNLTTGANASNVIFGNATMSTFTSGTHPWFANVVVKAPGTITNNGATVTNTSSLFIDGAGSGGTNNYAFYVNSGNSLFNAPVILKGYTVATLPTGITGMTAYVTDALTPSFGATLVGGGAIVTKAFYNGTNWIAE